MTYAETILLAHRAIALERSLRRLSQAIRQAGDIGLWPVCGEGDPVGAELRAAIDEAEEVLR